MDIPHKALVLGGTGRTGGRVLTQLLGRGIPVRALVRSAARLPSGAVGSAGLEVIEGDLLSRTGAAQRSLVDGCGAVISCLGHTMSIRGIFGPPRDLVTEAIRRMCEAVRELRPAEPVKLVLMSSVSVFVADPCDARRGASERAFMRALCALVPPARDNQRATDFLRETIGTNDPFLQWTVVRPDTLREGEISPYTVHPGLVSSLAKPSDTAMANVACFMCELVTNAATWDTWRFKLPVIINATPV
ncbi:MAG: SDR family oxidoreductase [Dehalococcoidia bacterium]|nr:SDR family oxidoreductase [Dehalococcoidia bacterium]